MEKKILHLKTQKANATNKKTLDLICESIYNDMYVVMEKMASFGVFEITFGQDHYFLSSLVYHLRDNPDLKTRLKTLLNGKGFGCTITSDNNVCVSWKDNEPILPTITAQDLTLMGYNTSEFGRILHELRLALTKGDATIQTQQSQIIWIQQNFPSESP